MGLGKLVIRVPCQHLRVPVRQFKFRVSFFRLDERARSEARTHRYVNTGELYAGRAARVCFVVYLRVSYTLFCNVVTAVGYVLADATCHTCS